MNGHHFEHIMDQLSVMIYPCYINSQTQLDDGRKIGLPDCVENPTLKEIFDAVKQLGFTAQIQDKKVHPRDFWHPGRIVVKFFADSDGNKVPVNSAISKRKQLYRAVAKKITEIRSNTHTKGKKGK